MTPSSPVDTIEKAMGGEIRRRAVDLVDTLVLERETNGQSKEFMDWAAFMTIQAFNEQRSRQAEAMKLEMAELRKLVSECSDALSPFADAVFNDNGDMTVTLDSARPEDFIRAYFTDRRARALIGGGNAED